MQGNQEELTAADLLQILRSSWLALLGFTVAGALVAGAVAFMTRPVYKAQVLISVNNPGGGAPSALSRLAEQFAPMVGGASGAIGGQGGGGKDVWIATLRSRRLTETFITESNLLPLLFPNRWDQSTAQWKVAGGKPSAPTMAQAFDRFDNDIRSVSEDRRTGLVTMSIEWYDRERVASWANDIVARANEFIRARAIAESQRSIEFLEAELKKTSVVEIQQVVYRLIESKVSEIMMANVRKEYAFAIIDPAVTPDADGFVRPRRAMLVVVGTLLGLLLGLVYAALRWIRRPVRP